MKWATAGLLVGLGMFRLVRSRHLAFGGMRVDARELATWSFLDGVGPRGGTDGAAAGHGRRALDGAHRIIMAAASVMGIAGIEWSGVMAALVHTAGYLLVTGVIAVIVYEQVGLRFLRTAWVNLDLVWAVALVVTGVAMVVG